MGSTPTSNLASRPPSGLSFGPMPVRERKRSLLDANIAPGLDHFRQTIPGVHSTTGPPPPVALNGHTFSDDKHSQSSIKQEGLTSDQTLVGLGLGGSSESQVLTDETYHRKRTKSVDMYNSTLSTFNSFSPISGPPAAPTTSLDMTTVTSVTHQGTTIQNWQPPDMALHLQVYQNNQSAAGEIDSNGNLRVHALTRAANGPMLRHSISHDRMDPSSHGALVAAQLSGIKAKSRTKSSKSTSAIKSAKSKVRSLSLGDALALDSEKSNSAPGSESGSGSGSGHNVKDEDDETGTPGEPFSSLDFEGSEIHGDPTARKQKLRYEGDQYTPQWVRNAGQAKEGFCDTCVPGKWLQLKNSAFW
jgi:hypothetical protein